VLHVSNYQESKYNLQESPNCEMRGEGRALHQGRVHPKDYPKLSQLFLLNHFYNDFFPYLMGTKKDYHTINAVEHIARRIDVCEQQIGRLPNFIAVDFVEMGIDGGAKQCVQNINQRFIQLARNEGLIVESSIESFKTTDADLISSSARCDDEHCQT